MGRHRRATNRRKRYAVAQDGGWLTAVGTWTKQPERRFESPSKKLVFEFYNAYGNLRSRLVEV